jgi:hypothetical protein
VVIPESELNSLSEGARPSFLAMLVMEFRICGLSAMGVPVKGVVEL